MVATDLGTWEDLGYFPPVPQDFAPSDDDRKVFTYSVRGRVFQTVARNDIKARCNVACQYARYVGKPVRLIQYQLATGDLTMKKEVL